MWKNVIFMSWWLSRSLSYLLILITYTQRRFYIQILLLFSHICKLADMFKHERMAEGPLKLVDGQINFWTQISRGDFFLSPPCNLKHHPGLCCTTKRSGRKRKICSTFYTLSSFWRVVALSAAELYIWAIWKSVVRSRQLVLLFTLTPQCWWGRCCPAGGWVGAYVGYAVSVTWVSE